MIYAGLLAFFVLEYMRPGTYFPIIGVLHLNTMVPLVVVVASIFSNRGVRNSDVLREPNTWMIVAFLGLIAGSVVTADVTLYAYNVWKIVFGYALIYWAIMLQVTTRERLTGILRVLVLIHVGLAVLTPEMFSDPEGRHYLASGTFLGDGNDYALSADVAIPFCIFLMAESRKWRVRLWYAAVALFLVLAVIATKSRGGTIALACMGLYYWARSDRKLITGTIAAGILAAALSLAPSAYFERMSTIAAHEDGSSQGRIVAWSAGIRMALDHPILGVGAGHFPVKFGAEYRSPDTEMPWLTAHSIYFLALGELGFTGLLTLLVFITANLAMNRRALRPLSAASQVASETRLIVCLSASLIAFSVGGAFLSALYYPHIYVLAALLAVARRMAYSELPETTGQPQLETKLQFHPALVIRPAAHATVSPRSARTGRI